jgi:hypothetical protein
MALSGRQADGVVGVINAILDGLAITTEMRERGSEIASAELRRIAEQEAQ